MILTHAQENLTEVAKMGFDGSLAFRRTTVHEDVVEVRLYEVPHRPEELRHDSIKRSGCIEQPLEHHQPFLQHPARGTYHRKRNIRLAHQELIIAVDHVERLKTVQPAMLFCSTSFRGIGVDAGMVAAFNLLKACTMRYFPLGFRTQNVGDECGDFDSRTMPAACFAAKKA
ncbi:unnamed protein product [Phytophthora fragariaefolia]|uniref:Unnamed protein product n=1 Tax=Phytophthora fragariaefolia TaxID=1490495 RepID=A0A9W6TIZ3_9STRA|nr:unnamed protein product [Phytophthora fragariaefolia]